MNAEQIRTLIESGLPASRAVVRTEDGTHFNAVVICEAFDGKRSVARHQMVYRALGEAMGREIHALSFRTLTPGEWEQTQAGSA